MEEVAIPSFEDKLGISIPSDFPDLLSILQLRDETKKQLPPIMTQCSPASRNATGLLHRHVAAQCSCRTRGNKKYIWKTQFPSLCGIKRFKWSVIAPKHVYNVHTIHCNAYLKRRSNLGMNILLLS